MSPLKSANRSVNDKVWTPWMADRGQPRHGASPRRGEQVESSRPQSGTREVSAVRSTDFLAGPRGLTRGARPLPLSRSPHKRSMKLPTHGERNHSTNPTEPHCRMARYTLIRPTPFQQLHSRRPDKTQPPSGKSATMILPDGALYAYPAYKIALPL